MATGVGIDVSKDTVDVATHSSGYIGQVARSPEGLRELVEALHEVDVHRVLVEASGGYEQAVLVALYAANCRWYSSNPAVLGTLPGLSDASRRPTRSMRSSSRRWPPSPSTTARCGSLEVRKSKRFGLSSSVGASCWRRSMPRRSVVSARTPRRNAASSASSRR